jgi:hypothetical protein
MKRRRVEAEHSMKALRAFKKARIHARGKMVEVPQEPLKPGQLFTPGIFTGERLPHLKYVPCPNDGYPPAPRETKEAKAERQKAELAAEWGLGDQPNIFDAPIPEPAPVEPVAVPVQMAALQTVEPLPVAEPEPALTPAQILGAKGGKVQSAAKTKAARENAKRPRKKKG